MSFRILIADDEPLIRIDLKELLEGIGHKVVGEARDGREAYDLIKQRKPDLVILDIKMPYMSGIELAKKIADRYPVVLLTAYSEQSLIEQARDAGVMAYLTKPFKAEMLSPAIELSVRHFLDKSTLADRVLRLREELDARKLVEKAKGLLMKSENITEAEAYRKIQKLSMEKSKSLRKVAEDLIAKFK